MTQNGIIGCLRVVLLLVLFSFSIFPTPALGFLSSSHQHKRINVERHQRQLHNDAAVLPNSMSMLMSTSTDPNIVKGEDISLRFSGVGRLYQQDIKDADNTINNNDVNSNAVCATSASAASSPHMKTVHKLSNSTVAIVGIGGVGSWAAEAIARSGIGNIILIDLDDICTSNINRQLHALSSTVGKMKIDTMAKRLLEINPNCNITLVHDFIGVDNAESIVASLSNQQNVDVILDAIDGTNEKVALIAAACRNGIPIVTVGGAAGRIDPTQIVCEDLSTSSQCRLLFWCKKQLRDKYKLFPKVVPKKGEKLKSVRVRKWRIWSVYSQEVINDKRVGGKDGGGGNDAGAGAGDGAVGSMRTCDGPLGTACFVTGTYGFVAASKVVSMLANDELIKPKILKSALSLPINIHK